MKSYSELSGVFTRSMIKAQQLAEVTVDCLPTCRDTEPIRCHEVARVVKTTLINFAMAWPSRPMDILVVDGHYHCVEHSWLVLKDMPTGKAAILDTYAVARLPLVQLVSPECGHLDLYLEGGTRGDIRTQEIFDLVLLVEERLRDTHLNRAIAESGKHYDD